MLVSPRVDGPDRWALGPRAAVTVGRVEEGLVWLERRVIAYAHQGGAWEAPSSTLHAIAHTLEAGATGR